MSGGDECESKDKKSRIYHACIVPKLMYGLQSCWLNQAELKRLDAFHYKCMRCIFKIPHSYISRVTNHDVGVQSNSIRLSLQLLKHQMMLYGRISVLHASHVLRKSTLNADSPTPFSIQGKRQRGRPRAQWANCVFNHVMHASRSVEHFMHTCTTGDWKVHVCRYIECLHASNID